MCETRAGGRRRLFVMRRKIKREAEKRDETRRDGRASVGEVGSFSRENGDRA